MTRKYVPLKDVPGKLQIALLTLYRWMVDGRLIIKTGLDGQGRQRVFVTAESIRNAYKVKCIHCGNTFLARGPKRARYCSIKCRNAYTFQEWKKLRAAMRRNPK